MHHNQHNLFETPIWGFVLHDQDLQSVDYTDYIISLSENETTQSKSNIGGCQSRDKKCRTHASEKVLFVRYSRELLLFFCFLCVASS